MKKHLFLVALCFALAGFSQTNYSDSWEDFYSYNNVKDFIKEENTIYALVDNAVFTYDLNTKEIKKISSVQGLSGETTSAIHYNKTLKRLVIGYQNGLIEVVDEDESITISSDIVNFNQSGEKNIHHISEFGNILYLSTPFAVIEYNIEKLEFGDTFFIGNNSSDSNVSQTIIANGKIFAATQNGIFEADVSNKSLIDFNNWKHSFSGRNFSQIALFNNQILAAENNKIFSFDGTNLTLIKSFSSTIQSLKSSSNTISVGFNTEALVLDAAFNTQFQSVATTDFNFTLNTAFFDENTLFLGTENFGILQVSQNQSSEFTEIHPEGPLSNDAFSIAVHNKDLWVVYGGYNSYYGSLFRRRGFSHFNGETWINTRFNPSFPVIDLNYISIDPNSENKVYISSFGDTRDLNSVSTGGMLVVENDKITEFLNHKNSGLEDLLPSQLDRVTLRISASIFDRNGNLWVANISKEDELKKLSKNGQWSSFNLASVKTVTDKRGLSEIAIDNNGSVWMGTRRNGIYIFNENGSRKKALIATPNLGNLPDTDVKTVAIDKSNRVWMGTRVGMVVYRNAATVFDDENPNATPVIIEENGVGERLLGDQNINSITIDGADNKWFGTDTGGALYTNPNGTITLGNYNTRNSPLPSNRILKIRIDERSGKVFFATDKGIVAFNSNVAPFGDVLSEVYAYPNPALKIHNFVTIDGRNGTHLPKGTNVKILDVSGNLVYESNVVEGQQLQGGKIIWDKKNLAGNKVASGVYIVLLSNDDATQTSVTKIAIVN